MDIICEINGLTIRKNSTYQIVDKIDNSALDGLRHYGSTKFPVDGICDIVGCPYNIDAGVFDTGFYIHSPRYSGLDMEKRKELVNNLVENIVNPFEIVKGVGVLDNKNSDFWENLNIELFEGRIFNTADVKDLLELYIAVAGFNLTPKDKIGDPRFEKSSYLIDDRTVTVKKRNERKKNYMDALSQFFTMAATDKHKLIPILKYAGIGSLVYMKEYDDEQVSSTFKDWIDEDPSHVDDFLRIVKMASKKLGMDEITIYSALLDKQKAKQLVKIGEEYVYEEIPLGADLKSSAKTLATKTSLKDLKEKLLSEE